MICKEQVNLALMSLDILTINSNTASMMSNFGRSFTLLEDTMQRLSLSKNSANSFPKESVAENSFDLYQIIDSSKF
jgi:hypothetical protein